MIDVVLYEPEIPPNTGNIIRLCANTGCQLHLIEPLGFELDDKRLRRAGLDYDEWASVQVHASFQAFMDKIAPLRIFACTTKGSRPYHEISYREGDALLFGPESRGLPDPIRMNQQITDRIRIPMQSGSRSLNLSNATAVILYEALRQNGFQNMVTKGNG